MSSIFSLLWGMLMVAAVAGVAAEDSPGQWGAGSSEASLTAMFSQLRARAEKRYTWVVLSQADQATISVPVDTDAGWQKVRYTVSYTRTASSKPVFLLQGLVVVENDGDEDATLSALPTVTITSQTGQAIPLGNNAVRCPTFNVPAGGHLHCNFTATYKGSHPTAGSVGAVVPLAAGSGEQPAGAAAASQQLKIPPAPFDFTESEVVTVGEFATILNHFLTGADGGLLVQPYTVEGQQPSSGMRLGDTREFTFTGYYGALARSQCGKDLKSVNRAMLVPSSSSQAGEQPPVKSSEAVVKIVPVCDSKASSATASNATFADIGSKMCGSGPCPTGTRCFDGFRCCPLEIPVCGGQCCGSPWTCQGDRCVPPGGTVCGPVICQATYECLEENLCCKPLSTVCNHQCCPQSKACRKNMCVEQDEEPCGNRMCHLPGEFCHRADLGLCCSRDNGETACGRFCCKRNQDCVNEQCVATAAAVAQPTQPLVVPIFASNRDQPQQLPQPQQQPIIINQPAQPAPQAPVIMPAQQPPVIIPPQMPPVIVPPNPPPVDTIPCGTVTCSPGQQCANAGTGLCCTLVTEMACGANCCRRATQVCNQFTLTCIDVARPDPALCPMARAWCPGAPLGVMCCPPGQGCRGTFCSV